MRQLIRILSATSGALFACLALAGTAQADTYPVNDPSDLPDAAVGNGICATAAGTCTLRAAIQEANAHAGPDTVTVPAGTYLLTRTGQFEGSAVTGDLDLRDTITIAGAGRDLTLVDGNLIDRVFDVFPAVSNSPMTVTLSGLTIRRGGSVSTGCGMDVNGSQTRVFLSQVDIRNGACLNSFGYGGIYFSNAYLLSMDDVVIDNNSGYYGGGGIYANGGRVVLSSTLIINNASQNNGGGASLQNGFVSINRSAIVDNRSSYQGGGLYLYYASGGITSTTIAGNFASSNGGGLYFYYSNGVSFGWNTIARNTSASFGGGVYNGFGTMTMLATLLGANTAANGPDAYCYGSLVSQGNSLIGDVTQCASSYYYSAGAGDITNVNPGVGAPISLGGTRVVPLVYASRAIDAGGATCPAIDQRSQPRPADGNADGSVVCDIGAYESQGSGELSLAGTVYADLDLNGAWNTGVEPGVPGVTITLAHLGSGLIITSTTAQDGSFAFGALTTGTFVLREYQPAAYDDGVDALGTAGGVLGNDVMTISLVAATPALSYTFGEYAFAVVSGTVYGDSNGNGAYDPPTEGGVFNVTLGLAGTTANGQPLSLLANTDGAGRFTFFPVPPGVYTLTETQPGNLFDGDEGLGSAGGLVSGPAPAFDVIANIPVTYGVPVTGYLFGELNSRNISALVFADLNGNGTYEYIEEGISGVAVQLTGVSYRGLVYSLTQLTDLYGSVGFSGLAPGIYTLTETQPEAWADGLDVATGSGVIGNDIVSAVAVTGTTQTGGATFGELVPGISGLVYIDANANGVYSSEIGIAGVTVWMSGLSDAGAGVWMTTTTDAQGRFFFASPLTGTYTLSEQQPPQYLDGFEQVGLGGGITGAIGVDTIAGIVYTPTTPDGRPVALVGNTFAEVQASSVEGFVYLDADNSQSLTSYGSCPGTCDPGIYGVTIVLTGVNDAGQTVWMTTTTTTGTMQYASYIGARYVFTPLRPGTYSIVEVQPDGYVDGPANSGSPYSPPGRNRFDGIALPPNTIAQYYNFGEYPAALGGYVYIDTNNDGDFRRGSEIGVSSVGITLTYSTITGATGIRTTTTDNYGRYAFTGLVTGVYTITELQPTSYADGRETTGDLPATVGNDLYAGIAYTPGVGAGWFNFGELYASSINVSVFWDRNGDGFFDSYTADYGISNFTVTLTGTTDAGHPIGPIALNPGPYYNYVTFDKLSPGVYSIIETQPAGGYVDGPSIVGNQFGGLAGVNRIDAITIITPGISGHGYAFIEWKLGLSGFAYLDANNNGLHDRTEGGYYPQQTLVLSATSGGGAYSTTLVGTDGFYIFTDVPSGTYQLTAGQASSYLDNHDAAGTVNGVARGTPGPLGTDIITGILYTTGAVAINYDFGEMQPARIAGTVYHDLNTNGAYDPGNLPYESGIRYVTVTLTGVNDTGAPVYFTRITDQYGAFEFATLRPGLYTLTETQPANWVDGREAGPYLGAALIGNDRFEGITITTPGSNLSGFTFGELQTSLYGFVFRDAYNDGIFDPYYDSGISNAQVILSGTTAAGQSIYSPTLTDGYGKFFFGQLVTGTYTLIEPQPVSYLDGIDTPGSPGGITSTLANGNDLISNIPITVATYGRNYLFAEISPAQLNGYVFLDLNGDGYYAFSEPGILSASLTLSGTNDRGQPIVVVTYTNASGFFSFVNLRPGTYTLSETQPSGYLDGQERNPNGVLSIVNDTFDNIVIAVGQYYQSYQFGESGSFLSGYVYGDKNNDGIRGSGEIGIAGVTVHLTGTRTDNGATVGRVAQTDGAGVYQFVNVPNGRYTITEIQPASWFDGRETLGAGAGGVISGNDRFISVTMTGPGGTNYNFGEIGPSTLSGAVFFDINDDGARDQNEPGIGAATLALRGTDYLTQPVWMTTTTDIYGSYQFTSVRMGVFTVTAVQPAGFVDGKDKAGCCGGGVAGNDAITGITVLGGDFLAQYYFGERISGLSGYVFVDSNNNGLRDEYFAYGANGIPVGLFGQTVLGQLVTRTTSTDSNGFYYFNDLVTGTYRITETQPALYLDGLDVAGNLGGAQGANDEISGIPFQVGQYGSGYNFGELAQAYLAGVVYWDTNNDGTRQGGEAGIPGATVVLSGTDDLLQHARITLTTDAGGGFTFSSLRPGTYSLVEIQPANYTDGSDAAGSYGGAADGFDSIGGIVLAPGNYATGYLFGERQVGLTGYVYRDLNNDGIRQAGSEDGVADTLIILRGATSLGDPVYRTALTNLYGFYTFGDPPAGTYAIVEYQPAGYLDGREQLGSLGGVKGQDIMTVTFGVGQYGGEYNFGELPPASINGRVYVDLNDDGVRQNHEAAVPAVNLGLAGVDDLGAAVARTAQTGGIGNYSFGNLRPGVYTVTEQQPAGYTDGQDSLGNMGGALIPTDTVAGISLTVAGYGYGYDFGERLVGVGGFVFVDSDTDGTPDPSEPLLAGVTLILTGTPAGGDPITRTAQTDNFGFYSFADLPAGSYRIRQFQPPAYLDGPDYAGTQGGTPGPLGQDWIDVSFPGSGFGTSYNFSEYPPNTIRGHVYFDLNDNGIFEWPPCCGFPFYTPDKASAETPVDGGVNIVLTGRNDLGEQVLMTDTTDSIGQYRFLLLRPGVYTVTEIQRDVDVDGLDRAFAGPEAVVANDQIRFISMTIGMNMGANFGEKPSIMGFVYRDDNDNGAFEPNVPTLCNSPELGIGGVALQLTGVDIYNNTVSQNATSFSPDPIALNRCWQGVYYWGGLVTGTYAIREFQPSGYLDGRETVGTGGGLTTTNDIISRIVFTPGTVLTGYLFGESRNVIAGYVYLDANGDGIRQGYEGNLLNPAVIWLTGTNNLGQAVVMSVTTLGFYQFTGLRPGTYTLTEWQPAGYSDGQESLGTGGGGSIGANDQFVNLVLAAGALASDYNFGELISSGIGGRVVYQWYRPYPAWSGQGLVSQTVRLTGFPDSGPPVTQTTLSDASGYYRFPGLAPGVYTVTHVNFPAGYDDFGADACGYQSVSAGRTIGGIRLQYGTDASDCDFKLGPVLTGYVFPDDNANSARDAGEWGIVNVSIALYGQLASGQLTTQTVSTDGGFFAFGGLLTGTYRLVESQPAEYFDGNDVAGSLGGLTGTASVAVQPAYGALITDDIIAGIVYTPNALGANYLFAELRPARIRGVAYYDKDDNTFYTPPLGGLDELVDKVDVYLDGTNDLGESIRMTNTDHSSVFNFTGLRPGTYTVSEVHPYSYTDGLDNVGSKGGVAGDDIIRFIPITWGDDANGYNFGERRFGIAGQVFADRNNNGTYEYLLGDTGIEGVPIVLSGTTVLGAPVLTTTLTNYAGYFSFSSIQPGIYTLSETQPAGYADGLDALGSLGGILTNDRVTGIVVGDQSFGMGYTFAELASSTLSGYVYVDANNDGYRGGFGEVGIPNVTITLQGLTSLGDPVLMVTRTNALGYYLFRGIPNGSYSLIETQPNFADGIDRAGTGASGFALNDLIIGIGFNMIIDAREYNFGERPSAISGHVFWDENGNGTRQISETGLSPATLRLKGWDFNNQPVNKTTKTTFEGYYAFEALPGTYWVEEVQPFGYLNGAAIPGTLGGVISGANVITGIVVGIGGAGLDYDFGEVAPTAIDLAGAMGLDLAFLQSASMQTDLVNKAGVGLPPPGSTTLAGFPTSGPTFAYLGTGNMLFADQPNTNPNTFGLGDYARLALTFTVPTTATCLSMDFAFFSEEFPEFVGSQFNDTFDAFVDGQPIARDQNGNRISINAVFGATPGNAAGTTYDAATPRLRARAALTPGATSVITFFVTDVSDTAYDSAVFIDKFTFGRPEGEACVPGANLPVGVVLTKTVGPWPAVGSPVCALSDAITVTAGTEVAYCYRATNTGEYTLTTHTLVDSALGPLFSQMPQELLPGETFEYITSRVETQTMVSVGTWTSWYSATFGAASSDVTTVTIPGSIITPTPSPGSATLMVMPGSAQTYFTQPITVAVMISGVTNLGGYEVALRFDPNQVTATHVTQGSFLTTTGRTMIAVPTRIGPDSLRFGASTIGAGAGPNGSGALAWVRIEPRGVGSATLTLSNTLATNISGLTISLTNQGGQLYVIQPGAAYLPRVLR